jgi:hypothetical protein
MWNAIARSQTSGLMRSEDSLKTRSSACLEHESRISMTVTLEDRLRLEAVVGDRNAKQKHVKRAKVILATADGCATREALHTVG